MSNVHKLGANLSNSGEVFNKINKDTGYKAEQNIINFAHVSDIANRDTTQSQVTNARNATPKHTASQIDLRAAVLNFTKLDDVFFNLSIQTKNVSDNPITNEAKKRSYKLYNSNFKAKYNIVEMKEVKVSHSDNQTTKDATIKTGLPVFKIPSNEPKEFLNIKRNPQLTQGSQQDPSKKFRFDDFIKNDSNAAKDTVSTIKTVEVMNTPSKLFPVINLDDKTPKKQESPNIVTNSYFNNQQNIHLNMNVTNIYIGRNKDSKLIDEIKELLLLTQNKYQELHDSLSRKILSFSIQNPNNTLTEFIITINRESLKIEKYEKILSDGKKSSIDCTMGEIEEKMVSDQLESIKLELEKKINKFT